MSFQYGYLTGTINSVIGDTDGDGDHLPDIDVWSPTDYPQGWTRLD